MMMRLLLLVILRSGVYASADIDGVNDKYNDDQAASERDT